MFGITVILEYEDHPSWIQIWLYWISSTIGCCVDAPSPPSTQLLCIWHIWAYSSCFPYLGMASSSVMKPCAWGSSLNTTVKYCSSSVLVVFKDTLHTAHSFSQSFLWLLYLSIPVLFGMIWNKCGGGRALIRCVVYISRYICKHIYLYMCYRGYKKIHVRNYNEELVMETARTGGWIKWAHAASCSFLNM